MASLLVVGVILAMMVRTSLQDDVPPVGQPRGALTTEGPVTLSSPTTVRSTTTTATPPLSFDAGDGKAIMVPGEAVNVARTSALAMSTGNWSRVSVRTGTVPLRPAVPRPDAVVEAAGLEAASANEIVAVVEVDEGGLSTVTRRLRVARAPAGAWEYAGLA